MFAGEHERQHGSRNAFGPSTFYSRPLADLRPRATQKAWSFFLSRDAKWNHRRPTADGPELPQRLRTRFATGKPRRYCWAFRTAGSSSPNWRSGRKNETGNKSRSSDWPARQSYRNLSSWVQTTDWLRAWGCATRCPLPRDGAGGRSVTLAALLSFLVTPRLATLESVVVGRSQFMRKASAPSGTFRRNRHFTY